MKKTFIIAEAGLNHNGSLKRAIKMVDIAKEAGADAIKFQTLIPELLVTNHARKAKYQMKNDVKNESQLAMLKRISLPFEAFEDIKKDCEKKKIEFMSTAFDLESLSFLRKMNMRIYKIPSGEITNLPLIQKIASIAKKVILSTGMSNTNEISSALKILVSNGLSKKNISILHCNTEYPTPMKNVNLNVLPSLSKKFQVNVGLSDHTLGIEVPIAAVAMGAHIIEKHFTLDRNLVGPDHKASLTPYELKAMIKAIRNIEIAFGSNAKKPTDGELKNLVIARKSIVASKSINKGDFFTEDNLTTKRPGNGISPMKWNKIIGQKSKYNFKENDLIKL